MKTRKVITGTLTIGALVLASMFAAAPAGAATLPAGQQISVIDSETGQISFANSDTAALTPVGPTWQDELEGDFLTGVDVDDDGQGYAIGVSYADGPDASYLYTADAKNGVLEYLAGIWILYGGDVPLRANECAGIDYTGGVLTLACTIYQSDGFDRNVAFIGTWDFDDEILIPWLELNGDPAIPYDPEGEAPNEPEDSFDYRFITAIASDPVGGKLYVFTGEGDGYFIYTASEDDGLTPVSDTAEYVVLGADFDRGGQLWVTTYRYNIVARAIAPGDAGLATLNPATGAFPFTAAWADQEQQIQPITVWGKEILPVSGPADPAAPIAGAALLLLAGTILAGVTALRRRDLKPQDGPAA